MFIKNGDEQPINVIEPIDLTDEETQKKLDALKGDMSKEQVQANQETK
jgi:hypothetical protein